MKTTQSLLLLFILFSNNLFAEEICSDLLKKIMLKMDSPLAEIVNVDKHVNPRQFIANFAKKNGVPVFLKQNQMGEEIPVILVNKKNSNDIKGFIENSFGTEVALQPGYSNDHGLLRTGNFIIDVDAPGYRGYGELHKTGLAWKDYSQYMTRRSKESETILEVTYLVTPEEKTAIDVYQRIRRSAIFRVKFAFKDFKTEDHPFLLNNGSEHCFIFCKAQAVTSHITELKQKVSVFGVGNVEEFVSKNEIQDAIKYAREIIMNTNPIDLRPEILDNPQLFNLLQKHFPTEVKTKEQKLDFIRWIISYDSSKEYNQVLKNLGVSGDYGVGDARNKRVSAILVYSESVDPIEFNKGNFTTKGAFTDWPNGNQRQVD